MDTTDKIGAAAVLGGTGYIVFGARQGMGWPLLPLATSLAIGGVGALLGGFIFGKRWAGAGVALAGVAAYEAYSQTRSNAEIAAYTNQLMPAPAVAEKPKLPSGQQSALTGWEPDAATGAGYYVGAILYATGHTMHTLGDWGSQERAIQVVKESLPEYCKMRNAGTGARVYSGGLVKDIDPKGRVTGVSFFPC